MYDKRYLSIKIMLDATGYHMLHVNSYLKKVKSLYAANNVFSIPMCNKECLYHQLLHTSRNHSFSSKSL